ncbi:pyridoxamine 5'-phosphate oxidase [Lysobacter terrae]
MSPLRTLITCLGRWRHYPHRSGRRLDHDQNRVKKSVYDDAMIAPDLHAEALGTFDQLFDEAEAAGEPDRTAMIVATATLDARPSARTLLLKAHDARGFVFYTHLDGRKGRELQANPHAALLFHWPRVRNGVQVRIEGVVDIVSDVEADAYFASRPRGSQLGAWASKQSETLDSRATFEQHLARAESDFDGREVPRPPRWSGLRVRPERIEFWFGAEFRMHERWLYELRPGGWAKRMLYP